jgi:hypothetical protein
MIFSIDNDNTITVHERAPEPAEGLMTFSTEKEFSRATSAWPASRLVDTWNSFAGVVPFDDLKPVKKFTSRATAVQRIWVAVQKLIPRPVRPASAEQTPAAGAPAKPAAGAPAKPAAGAPAKPAAGGAANKRARRADSAPAEGPAATGKGGAREPRQGTAKAIVITLISRKGGATLEEIMAATGWQKHTVRGFISTLPKKGGPLVVSTRRAADKARVYEAAR